MADKKGPIVSANKVAMSRALGAAFLNHQVEQLEKSVSNAPIPGSWRDRRQGSDHNNNNNSNNSTGGRGLNRDNNSRRPPPTSGVRVARKKAGESMERERTDPKHRRRLSDDQRGGGVEKDADVVVVDASVLVHALYQVKKWCKEGRQETVIVPLEALNTLDLLKKGTTALAQRARAASRILEAQVGTNPRILVQRDDAFVLWDKIDFKDVDVANDNPQVTFTGGSPEWVRRTICCARWEVEKAVNSDKAENNPERDAEAKPKVILAVLSSSVSPTSQTTKFGDAAAESQLAPVPLPTPQPAKYEARSSGALVGFWAARAGIEMMEVTPTLPGGAPFPPGQNGKVFEDEERAKRNNVHPRMGISPRGRRSSYGPPPISPAVGSSAAGAGLVERPPAVMAMMEMVSQPSKVVRVLARGEKLDPDP